MIIYEAVIVTLILVVDIGVLYYTRALVTARERNRMARQVRKLLAGMGL